MQHANATTNSGNKTLAQLVIERRAAQGMTQLALAEASGVSQSYLSQVEAGKRDPRMAILVKLAKPLGCKAKDLIPDAA